jgi:hypothetical protein
MHCFLCVAKRILTALVVIQFANEAFAILRCLVTNFTLPSGNFTLPSDNFTLPSDNFTLPSANFKLPSDNVPVPVTKTPMPCKRGQTPGRHQREFEPVIYQEKSTDHKIKSFSKRKQLSLIKLVCFSFFLLSRLNIFPSLKGHR